MMPWQKSAVYGEPLKITKTVKNRSELMSNFATLRYTPPTKYDVAPKGTVCKVICDNDLYTLYIQVSSEEVPNWLKMSDFFNVALHSLCGTPGLLEALMNLYDCKGKSRERDSVVGMIAALKEALDYL